jgi:CheY-like chemotaxis protein
VKEQPQQPDQPGPAGQDTTHPGGSETILLVEDRADVRELTASTLRELGYTVLEAPGAPRALELCQDRGHTIHLLMTDVSMPGMTGIELADRVRTYQPEIKILFMSGYSDPYRLSEQLVRPGCLYLQKPFTPDSLAGAARDLLDRN